jgi:ribosome-binding protein aMBF1 (putative translation factor)
MLHYPTFIIQLRSRLGWTQQDLAQQLDPRCTARTILRWEHGMSQPSRYYRERLQTIAAKYPD